VVQYIRTLKLA